MRERPEHLPRGVSHSLLEELAGVTSREGVGASMERALAIKDLQVRD